MLNIPNLLIYHTKVKDFDIMFSKNQLVKYLEIFRRENKNSEN